MRLRSFVFASLFASIPALAAPPAPQLSAEECAVWQREQSFARSVANRDAASFAGHVGEHAAFGASLPEPTRGREAIVKRWASLIEGKRALLRWYPTRVTMVPGVEDVAWSSGPSLFEVLDPKAKDRYLLGAFHSVWRKDADGVWRVLFDDGVEPRPATAEEVTAFNAGQAECSSRPQLTSR
ncbi:YybH family protein [Lysobacter niabensis]|uniref:YybH family protein n=1 Tax=Agrilutibacter niabensis TaxID=380628 RepID=UPI003612E98D